MNKTKEIWKDIKGYEGLYKISNLGNVKSLARTVATSNGKIKPIKEKILKATDAGRGYLAVPLSKDGKQKTHRTHQLVAIAFLNHVPDGMNLVINHIDFNRQNNNVTNLEIVTSRENTNKKHLKSTSKHVGVAWHKSRKKWQSSITINGKQKHLGLFTNELKASQAYQEALNNLK